MVELQAGVSEPPVWLAKVIAANRVVIFCSNVTDIRQCEWMLRENRVNYSLQRMGMGSADMRDRFHHLQHHTGWRCLPQIFVDGEFIGGEPELLASPLAWAAAKKEPIPAMALILGIAGLIPFVAAVASFFLGPGVARVHALPVMVMYAAAILAFMGGVQWGGLVNGAGGWRGLRYIFSVIPALLAWEATLVPPLTAVTLLIMGFVLVYGFDEWWAVRRWFPYWYVRLRRGLSSVVVLSLVCFVPVLLA